MGTIITEKHWKIKGVNGPTVDICGTADIPIEIGNSIFLQNTIIVDSSALEFPADVDIILGANFLVSNRLDVSTSRWSLLQSGRILQTLHPTLVDGKLFSEAESDYIYGSDLLNDSQPEVKYDTPVHEEILHSSLDEDSSIIKHTCIKNKKPKFYPNESLQQMRQPSYFGNDVATRGPNGHEHILEPDQPQPLHYSMSTVANVRIEANQMKMVDIAIADHNGLLASSNCAYKAKGGLITPGVVVLDAIVNSICTVAVLNFNSEFINLQKGIPLTSAVEITDDEELMEVDTLTDKGAPLHKPEVYSLLALSAMTEEAYVTPQEMDSEPDTLESAMEYNPAELSTEPVIYDETRFRKLLKLLKADTWKLSREQRRNMEKILFQNQSF